MLGGADNPNGELPSYITGADTDKDAMHQAVVQYAERAAEKLRGERQYCRQVTTFVRTSP